VDGEIAIAGFTSNWSGWVSAAVALSVARTVNAELAGDATAFGVPLITPALLNDIPNGTATLISVHKNGGVPPATLSVRVQLVPAVQGCRGLVLTAGAGLMVRLKLAVLLSFSGSVAVTLAGNVPETAGIPAMPTLAPVAGLTESPAGSPEEVQE
jgi:hypothetical protein